MPSSRNTIDTDILRIREVFAFNPNSQDFIQPYQLPMISQNGRLRWWSTLELLSSISVPAVSCSVLDILQTVQPGISTISTVLVSTFTHFLNSTAVGLGSMGGSNDTNGQQYFTGNGYVSTSRLFDELAKLSGTWSYISSTTLYDVINRLGHLKFIGDDLGPMSFIGSNYEENVGYVSTAHCGEYRIYRSTVSKLGPNLIEVSGSNNQELQSVSIDVRGYQTHLVSTSKLILDVDVNMSAEYKNGLQTSATFSNFLKHSDTQQIIGTQVIFDLEPSQSTLNIGRLSFMVKKEDLIPWPTQINLRHVQSNSSNDSITLRTNVPSKGGIMAVMDNLD
jgi:hypothetical protein